MRQGFYVVIYRKLHASIAKVKCAKSGSAQVGDKDI